MSAWLRENAGSATQPLRCNPPASSSIARAAAPNPLPRMRVTRASRDAPSCAAGHENVSRPSWTTLNAQPGCAIASTRTTASQRPCSVRVVRMNFRRAGTLWNRLSTSTVVPRGCGAGAASAEPSCRWRIVAPCSAEADRDVSESRETEAMLASASPRNPIVATRSRSAIVASLLVACRPSARASSSASMPCPSSRTRMRSSPPPSSSTSIRVAPASRLFSTSSLTMDAGRSTTSPAAIWLIR